MLISLILAFAAFYLYMRWTAKRIYAHVFNPWELLPYTLIVITLYNLFILNRILCR